MRKLSVGLLVLMLLLCAGCAEKNLEDFSSGQDSQDIYIENGGVKYYFYGFVSGGKLTGPQIGIIDGDKSHKVYEVKGYSPGDWLLDELDVIMERGRYSLWRAEHVTDIPEDFALSDEPGSHFFANYG